VELEGFIQTHYRPLLRTAYLLTGDHHAAEDLLQEALTKSWAYSQRHDLEQPGAFVRRCMINLYLSQWRRRARIREDPTEPANLPETAFPPGGDELAERDAVWHLLASLPRHQRVILVLRYYEDMGESQIADLLGVGVGAVRSGSWRGLERLRNSLALDTEDQHA
jgi:RNA polymerase sigma-70 factor (sigma-E family)